MYKGSCLCGCVQYEVSAFDSPFVFCHCSRCRKASGSAYASNAVVQTQNFKLRHAQEQLKLFTTEAGVIRSFCSECGSPIYSQRTYQPEIIRLRMGTLDTPLDGAIKPSAHIFVGSKAQWDNICDDLPQHNELP